MDSFKPKPLLLYILSVAIPVTIMMASLAGLGVTPFGDNSLVISDGNGLYINYLGYVGRAVRGQEDILFSFTKGLGGNMMGSWGWFLLNPTFALFAFADVTGYMQMYTYVSVLNLSLCGLTMYILLKDIYGHKASNLVFSTSYALNGFLVANVFQMNFFAVIPVLPIMVMGLRRLIQGCSPLVYILSLAYAVMMNFYFGFMLAVASALFFTTYFFVDRRQLADRARSIAAKYVISSLLAGALSSVVWLPALLSLRGGRLDQSVLDAISLKENMPFLDMFSKLFSGANSTAELSNGLPNIFVGILPVYLAILFFMSKKVDRKRKVSAGVLLGFYLVSFYVVVINIAMHGGTTTNWFNYRDSFIFCFLVLMVAAEEWQHVLSEPRELLMRATAIMVVGTLVVLSKRFEFLSGGLVVADLAILATMFLAFWMHKRDSAKNTMQSLVATVVVLSCVNLYLNYHFSTKNVIEWSSKEGEYVGVTLPVGALVDATQESDDGFYRMEVGEQRSGSCGNDPMLYGYYGVGHGGSDDRNFVRTALSELGVRRFDMRNSYGRGVPAATDALLGLKYLISKDDLTEEKGYERLIELGEDTWSLYKNPYALPVGMPVDARISGVEIGLEDIFENLNLTWSAMSGIEKPIFVEENSITFSSHNVSDPVELTQEAAREIVTSQDASMSASASAEAGGGSDAFGGSEIAMGAENSSGSQSDEYLERGTLQEKPENANYIEFTWTASRNGAVYTYNRSGMADTNGSVFPTLNYEGYHRAGDTITGYLPITSSLVTEEMLQEVAGRFRAVYADDTALAEMSQTLSERPSSIERIGDGHLRGTFAAVEGQELMFTIPYDEGWTLEVDGKPTELKQALGVFMVADVESGEHTYEMKFIPTGLMAGVAAAIVSLVLLIIYAIVELNKSKKTTNTYDNDECVSIAEINYSESESISSSLILPMGSDELDNSTKMEDKIDSDLISYSTNRNESIIINVLPNRCTNALIIIGLSIATVLICLKSSYNPFAPFQQEVDPSVFEYVGTVMSKGGVMYKDTFDHKGPLLYFINWLGVVCGGKIWFIEFASIFLSLVGCYLSFQLFFSNKILSSCGSAIVLFPMYLFFDHGNTVEEYALPFIIWGLYIFIRYFTESRINYKFIGACGFFLGCVLLLRINMIAMWLVFAIAVIIRERLNIKILMKYISVFIAGLILPFIPTITYLFMNQAIEDFVEQYILFNFQYSEASFTARIDSIIYLLFHYVSLPVIILPILLLFIKLDKIYLYIINLAYHIVNVFFICISGDIFTHYVIIIIPTYLLTTILLFKFLSKYFKDNIINIIAITTTLVLSLPWVNFTFFDLLENHNDYIKLKDDITNIINKNTQTTDCIIVCGNQDIIYLLADRVAASKYSYQLPIAESNPSIYEYFLKDIQENEPEVIVLNAGPSLLDFENLNTVMDHYLKTHDYKVWFDGDIKVFGKHPLST